MLLFSIIIPCYNHGAYIEDAIKSVLHYPNHADLEIIVINDGSTDPLTMEVLANIEKGRVKVIHQSNKGLGAARNAGLREAKGAYILPLDSDNTIDYHYLLEARAIFEKKPSVGVVYSDKIVFGEGVKTRTVKVPDFDPKMMLLIGNYIDACAIIRKKVIEETGGYAEDMPYMGFEDWEFWIRCLSHNIVFHHIRKPLFHYRDTPTSMLKGTVKKQLELTDYIIRKHHATYAQHIVQVAKEFSYMRRKPIRYSIKNLFKNII